MEGHLRRARACPARLSARAPGGPPRGPARRGDAPDRPGPAELRRRDVGLPRLGVHDRASPAARRASAAARAGRRRPCRRRRSSSSARSATSRRTRSGRSSVERVGRLLARLSPDQQNVILLRDTRRADLRGGREGDRQANGRGRRRFSGGATRRSRRAREGARNHLSPPALTKVRWALNRTFDIRKSPAFSPTCARPT